MTAASTLLGDYFEGPIRARWIAIQSATLAIAATILYLIGGMLTAIDWRAPFLLYGLGFPLALLAMRLLWEPKRGPEPTVAGNRQEVAASTSAGSRGFWRSRCSARSSSMSRRSRQASCSRRTASRDPARAGLLGSIGTLGCRSARGFSGVAVHWPIAQLARDRVSVRWLGARGDGIAWAARRASWLRWCSTSSGAASCCHR